MLLQVQAIHPGAQHQTPKGRKEDHGPTRPRLGELRPGLHLSLGCGGVERGLMPQSPWGASCPRASRAHSPRPHQDVEHHVEVVRQPEAPEAAAAEVVGGEDVHDGQDQEQHDAGEACEGNRTAVSSSPLFRPPPNTSSGLTSGHFHL